MKVNRGNPTQVRLLPMEREAIQREVDDGKYASLSEAIRDAIREKFINQGARA